MTNLAIAAYENPAAAERVARTLETIGIGAEDVHLLRAPDRAPATADLTTRERLESLGVPGHDAQLLADMVQGGATLVVAAVEGEALRQALAALAAAEPNEPLAVFNLTPTAARPL